MSSAEDEYKSEGRFMQLSPQEQMKYVNVTIEKMKYLGDLNRVDILNLLRETLKDKNLNEYTADSDQTYQAFLKVYHKRNQGQGGRRKSKSSRYKKSRSKSRSKKSRSKKSRSKSRK